MPGGASQPYNTSHPAPASGTGGNWWDFLFNDANAWLGPQFGGTPTTAPAADTKKAAQQQAQAAAAAQTYVASSNPLSVSTGFELNNQKEQAYLKTGQHSGGYNYYVWDGNTQQRSLKRYGEAGTVGVPTGTLASDYIQKWMDSSSSEIASLQDRLAKAFPDQHIQANGLWDDTTEAALGQAMQWSAQHPNDPSATPDAFISQRIAFNLKNGLLNGPKTYTVNSTNTHYLLSNPEAAKGFLENALVQYLGRMPDDTEVKQFTSMLNAQERAHPEVTKTHSTRVTDATGQQHAYDSEKNSSSVTSGGYGGQQQYAEDYARAQPGSAEYQTANLMDAFDQLLRGPAGPGH